MALYNLFYNGWPYANSSGRITSNKRKEKKKPMFRETHKDCFGMLKGKRECFFCLEKAECFQETTKVKHRLAIDFKTRKIVIY